MIEVATGNAKGSLARTLVAGAGMRVGALVLTRMIGIARVVIFARVFLPEEMGIAALALSCVAIGAVLTDLGFFQSVLLARDERVRPLANTAFALSLALGLTVFAGLYLAAPLLSDVLRVELTDYIRVLGVLVLAVPLQFPRVFWQRRLRFGHPSAALLVAELANLGTAVVIEVEFGLGVWSLVLGHVCAHLLASLYVWTAAVERPRLRVEAGEAVPLLGFGAPLLVFALSGVIMDRADNMMVGGLFGPIQLAYYDFAWQIPLIIAALAGSVDSMLLPLYARAADEPERLSALFNIACKLWAIVGSFFCVPLILFAEDAVVILYGPRWLPAAPFLQVMAVSFMIRFCTGYAYDNLVLVRRRTPYIMKWGLVNSVLLLTVGLAIIRTYGPMGGAWYWMVQAVVLIPLIRLPLIWQELRTLDFLGHVWQPLVAAGAGAAAAMVSVELLPWRLAALVLAAVAYTMAYATVIRLVDPAFVRRVLDLIHSLRSTGTGPAPFPEMVVGRL